MVISNFFCVIFFIDSALIRGNTISCCQGNTVNSWRVRVRCDGGRGVGQLQLDNTRPLIVCLCCFDQHQQRGSRLVLTALLLSVSIEEFMPFLL